MKQEDKKEEEVNISNEPKTYICLGNEEYGNIELDLITFKEKGQKVKYFSVGINQIDGENQNYCSINLDEESFKTIKTFFEKLDWNS